MCVDNRFYFLMIWDQLRMYSVAAAHSAHATWYTAAQSCDVYALVSLEQMSGSIV
jgi:hypothetical protein